jgi:hypothetical protein
MSLGLERGRAEGFQEGREEGWGHGVERGRDIGIREADVRPRVIPPGVFTGLATAVGGIREWRPWRAVLYVALLVIAILALVGGLVMIFDSPTVSNGIWHAWEWFIRPG